MVVMNEVNHDADGHLILERIRPEESLVQTPNARKSRSFASLRMTDEAC